MQKKDKQNRNSLDAITTGFPVIAQGLEVMNYTGEKFSFVASAVCALISIWGNFANKKASDFMKQFKDNEDDLIMEVVESDKFISVFLEMFDRNIKESNENKRQLLKNYVLNMACGIEPDFDEHTKLINTLNNITLEELDFLKLWDEDGAITEQQKNPQKRPIYTLGDIASVIMKYPDHELLKDRYIHNQDRCNRILLALGYKDLLYVLSEPNFGSGQEARVRGITDFGKVFLRFIRQ